MILVFVSGNTVEAFEEITEGRGVETLPGLQPSLSSWAAPPRDQGSHLGEWEQPPLGLTISLPSKVLGLFHIMCGVEVER